MEFTTLPAMPNAPCAKVHVDILCRLPEAQEYKHVLVVMDSFTKYLFTYPLKSSHPKNIVEGLTRMFTNFG